MNEVGDREYRNLFERISTIPTIAKQQVVQTVNHTMVYSYFEIGRAIVEVRQHGDEPYGSFSFNCTGGFVESAVPEMPVLLAYQIEF